MKTKCAVVTLLAGSLLTVAPHVMAQECTTQYGGTTTCVPTNLTINKQVANPATGVFVENLGSSDPTFSANSEVHFRLTVKNAGNQTLTTVTVKDVFPSELTFVSGPGTFDRGSNTLTFTLNNLAAAESRTQEILAKIDPNKVYKQRSLSCVVNTAIVSAGDKSDQDTAQLCIQTNVLGATTLPVAGFENRFLLPFAAIGLIGFSLFCYKKQS